MHGNEKVLRSGSAAIVFFTVTASATAVAAALLPFFIN